jgi:REP element-mobilizing transposase RayT
MAFKYKITDVQGVYFMTITVVDWIDVFTRRELADDVIASLEYCQKAKGLCLYAWCLMPSHLHLIASAKEGASMSDIMRDFKKFTSKKVVKTIQEINESRKDWLLDKFEFAGRWKPKIEGFKFWQDGYHPILLESNYFLEQKLDYLHENPVNAGLVFESYHYRYSSAIDYSSDKAKGLLDIMYLD